MFRTPIPALAAAGLAILGLAAPEALAGDEITLLDGTLADVTVPELRYPMGLEIPPRQLNCDVWLVLDGGMVQDVKLSECHPSISDDILRAFSRARYKNGGSRASGWFGIQVSHRRDADSRSGVEARIIRPKDGTERLSDPLLMPLKALKQAGRDVECDVTLHVDEKGRLASHEITGPEECTEPFRKEIGRAMKYWRWHPLEVDGERMPFTRTMTVDFDEL